jgi:acetyltransferase-like isoleucine patch superfamily enzyme
MILNLSRKIKKYALLFRRRNIIYGKNVIIDFKTVIINNGNILKLGSNVYLRSISKGYQAGMPFPTSILLDVKGAEVEIGDNSRINGVYIHAQKSISIGKNCVIASGVNIIDTNGHVLLSLDRTIGRDTPEEIIIEDNVWIGLNCTILKGTKIGKNSVVSTGSVVKGIFPANSLIHGNLATMVKELGFSK